MYKILIVDDEPIAVESVAYMVTHNMKDAIVAGTCRSGKEAIEKAAALHPDIVIMDIDMPGINGLGAIKQIKASDPDVSFIVLTAFDYFDYAMESLAIGVADYLVKPVNENKFVLALRTVMNKLDQAREKKQQELQQQERLEMTLPVLEDAFHKALRLNGGEKELQHYCSLLGHEDIGGYIIVAETNLAHDEAWEKLSILCQKFLKRTADCIVDPARHHRVTAYVFAGGQDAVQGRAEAIQLARDMAKRVEHEGMGIAIGIGRRYDSVKDAVNSFREARLALRLAAGHEKYRIMHYSDMSGSDVQTVSERLGIQEQLLLDRIGEIDTDGVDQALDQLSVLLQGYNDMARMRNSLAELIHSIGRRWDLPVENCHAAASEIMDPGTPDAELFSLLREHIESAMYRIAQSRHQKPAGVIQLADTYMEEHYAEQISLEDIADHVKLSSFYFSRFYKKETGQNFTDRLAQIRIDHARELLRHEELSIKMVAYLVGYQEPNYFSRIFKRISGYTASDYKRMITEGEVRDL